MSKRWRILGAVLVTLSMSTMVFADVPSYYNQQEYNDELRNNYDEDRGIVVENNPQLGYITYKNTNGKTITRNYYSSEVTVEKQPYYESEDKIGYIDELFPNFSYDARDVEISSVVAGDSIYIKTNANDEVVYISAYNDYIMRYGKVVSFTFNTQGTSTLLMVDQNGRYYSYDVPQTVPVTKGSKLYSLSSIKSGEWVKVLVSQRIMGEGIIEEAVEEIVVDNDTRTVSGIYRGQVTSLDLYKNALNVKSAQKLGKLKWGSANGIKTFSVDPKNFRAYLIGNLISTDYINRNLKNADGYAYVAAENYKGKENAVKVNFQSKLQTTLEPSTVIYASGNTIKLLSGQTIYVAEDAIITRDDRLVDISSIFVGDTLQAVVTGEDKLAVGNISSDITSGSIEVYRGRIKSINEGMEFEVETFSLLNDSTWYYHPTPHTFTIDSDTKLFTEKGVAENGVEDFLAYGENTTVGDVYTIVAIGDHAVAILDMPYVRHSVKGQIYKIDGESLSLKDVYYYNTSKENWLTYSNKNYGATINLQQNTVIIKDGKIIPASKLEKDDILTVMTKVNLKEAEGTVDGYIIIVEN